MGSSSKNNTTLKLVYSESNPTTFNKAIQISGTVKAITIVFFDGVLQFVCIHREYGKLLWYLEN